MKAKAAILYRTNEPLVIDEIELPPPQKGQVLVKILYSGVCRSQLNEIKAHKGSDKFLPHTLGHEASGIVEQIGENVTKVKKGDYVILTWIKCKGLDVPSCTYLDSKGQKINSGAITTFSQFSIISENRIVKINEKIAADVAVLFGCAIPTGAGIIKNELKLKKNNSIAIFGIGGIGFCALLEALAFGADPIIAVDVNTQKLDSAKRSGATHILNPLENNIVEKIKEITLGKGVDYSVDCSGKIEMIEAAFDSISYTGTTIIAGNPAFGEKIKITPFDLIKGKKIFGSWGGSTEPDKDIPIFIKEYLQKKLRLDKLTTRIYLLNEINQSLDDLEKGEFIRAIIKMHDEP